MKDLDRVEIDLNEYHREQELICQATADSINHCHEIVDLLEGYALDLYEEEIKELETELKRIKERIQSCII